MGRHGVYSEAGVGPACAVDDETLGDLILSSLALNPSDSLRAVKLAGPAAATVASLLRAGFRYQHVLLLNGSSELNEFDRYAVSVSDALSVRAYKVHVHQLAKHRQAVVDQMAQCGGQEEPIGDEGNFEGRQGIGGRRGSLLP